MAQKSNRIVNWMTHPRMFWILLFVASSLMVVGHWRVMRSGGTVWRGSEKIPYYWLDKVFVSEFAAKSPQGAWIKASILVFCLMIAHFTWDVIKWTKGSRLAGLLEFFWLWVGTAMVGGLLLVVAFDAGSRDFLKELQHQWGFRIFMLSFGICAGFFTGWDVCRKPKRRSRSIYLFILIVLVAVWLFGVIKYYPGVPQRALLIMMVFWLVREHRQLQSELKLTTHPVPELARSMPAA